MTTSITIPGYELVRELGSGGMAKVYLAIQSSFGREVALKIMSPLLANDGDFSERFLREARIVAQMRHNNIVSVYDVGQHDQFHYMSMEYLPGGDLKNRILQQAGPALAVEVSIFIASALAYAHNKGFLHRDIKPENIMFREDGTPVLTDFGIARALDAGINMTKAGVMIGTPSYMSPEQAKGEHVDARTDLYSLGVVFYECLTGYPPYRSDSTISLALKHLNEPVPTLPDAYASYQPIIDKIMAKKADDRYASGEEFIDILSALEIVASLSSATQLQHVARQRNLTPAATPIPVLKTITQSKPSSQETQVRSAVKEETIVLPRQETGKNNKRNFTLLLVSLVIIITGGYLLWNNYQPILTVPPEKSVKQTLPGSQESLKNSVSDDRKQNPKSNQNKTDSLIAQAETAEANGNLAEPVNDNALFYYQQASLLDAKNKKVLEGLSRLSDLFLRHAEQHIAHNNYEMAATAIQKAIQAKPNNQEASSKLQALLLSQKEQSADTNDQHRTKMPKIGNSQAESSSSKTAISSVESAAKTTKEKQITELLNTAKAHRKAKRITRPEGRNAVETYQKILSIAPENEIARFELNTIIKGVIDRIESTIKANDLEKAEIMLSQARRISSTHPELLLLEKRWSEKKTDTENKRQRQAAMQANTIELIEKSQQELSNMNLNGIEKSIRYYSQAKQILPKHHELKPLQNNILDTTARLAQSELEADNYQQTLDIISTVKRNNFSSVHLNQIEEQAKKRQSQAQKRKAVISVF